MNEQNNLALNGALMYGGLIEVPLEYVALCNTVIDAVKLCMSHSKVKRDVGGWAKLLNTSRGNLDLILNRGTAKRNRYPDPDWFEVIEHEAGNRAITQYFSLQSQGLLNRQRHINQPQLNKAG